MGIVISTYHHIKMSNKVLVIGAINIDILASSNKDLVKEDSNLANITFDFGGVGGNIATNLANLNVEVSMLSTLGDDYLSDLIINRYNELGISLKYTKIKNKSSNIYLAVLDKNDLYLGLNDMSLTDYMDQAFMMEHKDYINQFDYLVIDNNLSVEALNALVAIKNNQVLIADAVSMTKAPKLKAILSELDYLKVNKQELAMLSNEKDALAQIKEVSSLGVKNLIVTNKQEDIILYKDNEIITTHVIKTDNIVSTSGCGDAFISGVTYGIINKKPILTSLEYGKQLASQTLQVKESTNKKVKINDK